MKLVLGDYLKTDDSFFEKVSTLAKHLHLTKSELIRRSITEFELLIQKKEMKEQMKRASMRVREANRKIANEFDDILHDGLENV